MRLPHAAHPNHQVRQAGDAAYGTMQPVQCEVYHPYAGMVRGVAGTEQEGKMTKIEMLKELDKLAQQANSLSATGD